MWTDHLWVVVYEQFGDTTLSVHQEAISSPFLGERRLVTRGNQRVQLALATTHQLHKLEKKSERFHCKPEHPSTCTHSPAFTITCIHVVLNDGVTFNAHCTEKGLCEIIFGLLHYYNKIQIIKHFPFALVTFSSNITLQVAKPFHPLISIIFLHVKACALSCLFSADQLRQIVL